MTQTILTTNCSDAEPPNLSLFCRKCRGTGIAFLDSFNRKWPCRVCNGKGWYVMSLGGS